METQTMFFYYNEKLQAETLESFTEKCEEYFGKGNFEICTHKSAIDYCDLDEMEWLDDSFYIGDELASIAIRLDEETVKWSRKEMEKESVRATIHGFFFDHPSIDKSKFSRECGMHPKTIDLVLNKGREIPKKHLDKVIERMAHYGKSDIEKYK